MGLWINNTLINILAWKMDSKCFEKAQAHALTKRKPLVPSVAQLKAPSTPSEPSTTMMDW